ncbi:MAG: hypothetical protein ACON5H_05575 [Akkermansiaceae bacterium]
MQAVEDGTVVPGSSLMGRVARERLFSGEEGPLELDAISGEETDVSPEQEWPNTITENDLSAYFRKPPTGFLMDPQNLLTPQEKRDREGVFSYHAKDSAIDIYFYLFDTKQELPEGESPERVMKEFLQDLGPSVVVFYYLGMPERTQIVFSPLVERMVSDEEQRMALMRSVEEALDRTGEVAQVESFSVQLSIWLYRIEKELGGLEKTKSSLIHPLSEVEIVESQKDGLLVRMWNSRRARSIAGGMGLLFFAAACGILAKWFADRKRIYVFPESKGELLLDAPHAAGVGALITYESPSLPPSRQRDDVPDYLQRM